MLKNQGKRGEKLNKFPPIIPVDTCTYVYIIQMHVEHSVTTVQRVGSLEITCKCASKADKMRGFQYILLCALLNSIMVNAFYSCESATYGNSCPDNSACVDVDGDTRFECECNEGFDVVDLPGLTMNGRAATVCIGMDYSIKKGNFGSYLLYVFNRISLFWGEEYTRSIIIK